MVRNIVGQEAEDILNVMLEGHSLVLRGVVSVVVKRIVSLSVKGIVSLVAKDMLKFKGCCQGSRRHSLSTVKRM